jgi:3-hydroxyanthranilate 3,4-dioxygenase
MRKHDAGCIPHSPQRKAGTVGMVLERERLPTESDGLTWYARDGSTNILYQEFFHCTDLGVQLKPVIERFFSTDAYKTGIPSRRYSASESPIHVDNTTTLHEPFNLKDWIKEYAEANPTNTTVLFGRGAVNPAFSHFEYSVTIFTGPVEAWESGFAEPQHGEVFCYQLEGNSLITILDTRGGIASFELKPGFTLLVPGKSEYSMKAVWGKGACMMVTNSVVA